MRNLGIGLLLVAAFTAVITCQRWLSVDWSGTAAKQARDDDILDAQFQYLNWSFECRDRAARAVAAGQITLLEGAAYFAAVEAQRPPTLTPRYDYFSGDSVEEKLCRHVIHYVDNLLWRDPRQEAVVKPLQDELQNRLARGSLRLPDLPPGSVSRCPVGVH